MCGASYTPPPPPPAAPPTLDQLAPKTAGEGEDTRGRKKRGLSAYRMDATAPASSALGSIPKKAAGGVNK